VRLGVVLEVDGVRVGLRLLPLEPLVAGVERQQLPGLVGGVVDVALEQDVAAVLRR
jgi:hypothetical protein